MKISRIFIDKESAEKLEIKDGKILGEKEKKAGRLAAIDEDLRRKINDGFWAEGLCIKRFCENLTIENFKPKVGEKYEAENMIFHIEEVGKRCFSECKLVQRGEICGLKNSLVFIKGEDGFVNIGDEINEK